MSLFEFIIGMISVLIALAVAQLMVSAGRLAQNHTRVRTWLPHTLWNVIIFLLLFLHWWSLWDFRNLQWNVAMFLFSLCGPMLTFFAVTLLTPDIRSDGLVDLRAHFLSVRALFFSVFLVAILFFTLDGPLFGVEQPLNKLRFVQVILAASVVAGLLTARSWVQHAVAVIIISVLVALTAVRFLPGEYH